MNLKNETGNVVIESVLGILIFAGVIFPATSLLSELATKQSEVSNAVLAIGRSWSVVDKGSPMQNLESVMRWMSKNKSLQIQLECSGGCSDTSKELKVTVKAKTGFELVPEISESYEFNRDVYAD